MTKLYLIGNAVKRWQHMCLAFQSVQGIYSYIIILDSHCHPGQQKDKKDFSSGKEPEIWRNEVTFLRVMRLAGGWLVISFS